MSARNMMKGWTKPSANCKPLFQVISGAQPSKHECLMVWISQVSPLFVISVLVPEIEPPVFPWRPTLWLIVHAPARPSLKWIIRAGALRPIKSPKGTSTPWPQSFQGRYINIPKGTSIQRNPHGHGPMCWCRLNSYNTLKSILSYGKYVTKPT